MAQQSMGSSVPLKSSDQRDCRFSIVDGGLAEFVTVNRQSAISSLITMRERALPPGNFPQGSSGLSPFFPETWREDSYFTSTVAPASVNFFLMVAASSWETPSLIALGAPSTKSLASFSPRLVTSRTALMTLILLAPTAVRTTENSVCSSAGAAAAAAPAPATAAGPAAAADPPKTSSSRFTSSAASSRVNTLTSSTIFSTRSDMLDSPLRYRSEEHTSELQSR